MFMSVYIEPDGGVTVTNYETEEVHVFEAGSEQANDLISALSVIAR